MYYKFSIPGIFPQTSQSNWQFYNKLTYILTCLCMYAMDKFQISVNPKLKNINNPNEDVFNSANIHTVWQAYLKSEDRQSKIYDFETADYTGSTT